jgi:YegS/Rv2252/BmrU family lipid kinase
MKRIALIDNPASGQNAARRDAALQGAQAILRGSGAEAEIFSSHTPGAGVELAQRAMQEGYDTVLACGGDGTVHAILQSLVGSEVALGVIPLGTANALAADLGLAGTPAQVATTLLQAVPTRVRVGRVEYRDTEGSQASRYFLVAAGIGADALLMARMDPKLKRRFGYAVYLAEAFRIWATDPFPLFAASAVLNGNGDTRAVEVSQLLAVRIRTFGGALHELAPGATLRNGHLSLLAFQTRSRLAFLRFLLAVICRRHTFSCEVELLNALSVDCRPRKDSLASLYVEADGEVLGHLPARIEVSEETVMLLIPPRAKP